MTVKIMPNTTLVTSALCRLLIALTERGVGGSVCLGRGGGGGGEGGGRG